MKLKVGFAHMQRKCRPVQTFPIPGIPAWLTAFLLIYVWAEKWDTAACRVAGPVILVWISATGLREPALNRSLLCVCVHVINPLWNWPCNLHIQYHCRLFSWVGERVFADLCRHISENLQYTFHTQESVLWHSVAFWWTEWDNLDSLQKPCVSQSLTSPWACIITSDSLSGVVKHRETHTHLYLVTLFLCQRAGGMKPQTWKGTVSLTSHFKRTENFMILLQIKQTVMITPKGH